MPPALLVALLLAAPSTAPRPWEDLSVSMRNVEPPRAAFVPYATADDALAGRSPFALSLDGAWRFHWAPTPEAAPALFHEPSFDDSKWPTIPVPSNWEMEGFGHPVFRNVHQPFPA